jgi:hypothetical protein
MLGKKRIRRKDLVSGRIQRIRREGGFNGYYAEPVGRGVRPVARSLGRGASPECLCFLAK